MYLEEFGDFGPGIDAILKGIRIHKGELTFQVVQGFADLERERLYTEEGIHVLVGFNANVASKELYKFLHQRLTVKLKAGHSASCPEKGWLRPVPLSLQKDGLPQRGDQARTACRDPAPVIL